MPKNEYRKLEEYEDIFHDAFMLMLPKFNPSNIRPAYLAEGGFAAKNQIQNNCSDGLSGFSNKDNFIYLSVLPDSDNLQSFTYPDGSVRITRSISLRVSIYGEESDQLALITSSLIHTDAVLNFLNSKGLYIYDNANGIQITNMNEEINAQFWRRRDYVLKFNEGVTVINPNMNKYAEKANMEVIVDESI